MSIARQFLRELRPIFRMLEEPITRSPSYYGLPTRSIFEDPFFQLPAIARPSVDLTEEGNSYILQAELPGVKKENIELKIGDGGRSVTVEGKIPASRSEGADPGTESSTDVTQANSQQISAEGVFTGSSTFTRTVWLPRQVDGKNVNAKLSDGILTVRLAKAEDNASVKVPIE